MLSPIRGFDKVYACTAGSVEAGTTMVTNHRQETFCQRVVASAIAHQDRVAMTLIEPQGKETTTFGSMLAQIRSIAYRLSLEGVAFGDRVGLMGEKPPNRGNAYIGKN